MTIAEGVWQQIFSFDNYGELLALVRSASASAALLLGVNIVGGSIVGSLIAAGTIGPLGSAPGTATP